MEKLLKYCPKCLGNNITSKKRLIDPNGSMAQLTKLDYAPELYYTIYKGFIKTYTYQDNSICPTCKEKLIEMHLTEREWDILNAISLDQNFIFAMDKLKQDDIIEFTTKMSQYKEQHYEWYKKITQKPKLQSAIPKCPTCGSTDIKKISGTKRWLGVGLFGLASSDVGKTMQCNSCGYKF